MAQQGKQRKKNIYIWIWIHLPISQMVILWPRKQSIHSPSSAPGCHRDHVAWQAEGGSLSKISSKGS